MTVDLTLITITHGTPNANGYVPELEHRRKIIADRTSARRAEFYEANKAGIKPTAVYRIHPADYADYGGAEPMYAEEGGIKYEIIRTYETSPDSVELTCARVK